MESRDSGRIPNLLEGDGVIGIQPAFAMAGTSDNHRARGVRRAKHRSYLTRSRLSLHNLPDLGLFEHPSRRRMNEHHAGQKRKSEQFHETMISTDDVRRQSDGAIPCDGSAWLQNAAHGIVAQTRQPPARCGDLISLERKGMKLTMGQRWLFP